MPRLEPGDRLTCTCLCRMFLQVQPAHLQRRTGVTLRGEQEREARARLVRDALGV